MISTEQECSGTFGGVAIGATDRSPNIDVDGRGTQLIHSVVITPREKTSTIPMKAHITTL